MTISSTMEYVTPDMALDWLTAETNCGNRKLKPAVVRKYARDMRANNWLFNGDTLKFDWNGKLLDGQHRLHAVVELDHPVQFLVVRGLNPDAYAAIDTGARRTAGDMMQHIGSKHSAAAAAAAKVLHWYLTGQTEFNVMHTTSELVATYRAHPKLEAHVAQYDNSEFRKKLRVGAAWPVVAYLVSEHAPELWAEFAGPVASGIGLQKGDPRHTFREWLLNRLQGRRPARNDERFNIICKAWNAFVDGRPIQVLAHRYNEAPARPLMSR